MFNVSFLCSVLALLVFLSILVAQCQLSVYCFDITGLLGVILLFNVSFLCSVLALLVFLGCSCCSMSAFCVVFWHYWSFWGVLVVQCQLSV